MKRLMTGLSVMALVTSLAACGGTNEPAANVVANDMNTMAADPNNPFAQSEMAMDKAMMAAVGVNAADSWVRKMIEHHRGAIEMSRIVLAQSPTANVAAMAQMTIDNQGKEITDLEKLIASGNPDPASAELYRPAAMEMHSAMMAASGGNVSETYLRKMQAHHQGAVAMSDVALANGATGAVRARIEKTKASQQGEIAHVEAMLRGDPMTAAPASPAAQPTVTPTARPAEPRAAAPKPAAPKPASAKPTPKPPEPKAAEPKAPDTSCLPEHRAAGHC